MGRQFAGGRLVLATHNSGKIREFETLLAPLGAEIVSAAELGLGEPDETGLTFAANARLKAQAAVAATGLPALADDSGLAAYGLDGAPGIYSARWAGADKDFGQAMAQVRTALIERYGQWADADQRAAFIAVLCLAWPDGHTELAEGRTEGILVAEPRGSGGFGYDPMFIPEGQTQTFGELPPATKHQLSHRARATQALIATSFTSPQEQA